MSRSVAVFIDGRNCHYRLVELGWPTRYDVRRLGQLLAGHDRLTRVCYFNAQPSTPWVTQKVINEQTAWYQMIRNSGVEVHLGYLTESEGKAREKLVDVLIAVEMIMGAVRNDYDLAILATADSDLTPAVKAVQSLGKPVRNVSFKKGRSFRLSAECAETGWFKQKHFTAVNLPASARGSP